MQLNMRLFDLLLTVDPDGSIYSMEWKDKQINRFPGTALRLLAPGGNLFTALDIRPDEENGAFRVNDELFGFDRFSRQGMYYYLIKSWNCQRELLKAALDTVQEGIQVYDSHACAVYFNKTSRAMSGLEDVPIEGKHLLDLYPALSGGNSTLLTTLRSRKPVYYLFDDYTSVTGKRIATINTGYPLMAGSTLVGAVVFEQDVAIVQDKLQQLEKMKAALMEQGGGQSRRGGSYTFADIIGRSEALRRVVEVAERVSLRDGNVLLVGETGTGKELFAQSIHAASPRKNGKFVSINCAAVPETLIEGMLFGTTKGAFTGSVEKPGLFEEAQDGTLFLDELNSMSLAMQSKILRVLQEGTFRRVGGTKDLHTNARIISACNQDPYQMMEGSQLRQDLFYRIATILIRIPPLRERVDDIEELAYHHLRENAARYALGGQKLAPETLELLRRYSWPGNIRELNHALDYALNVCNGETLLPEHLPETVVGRERTASEHVCALGRPDGEPALGRLQDLMDDYECLVLKTALRSCQGNISKAAALLDIKRQSLQYRIHKYNIII